MGYLPASAEKAACMGRATTVQSLFPYVWPVARILSTEVNFFNINYKNQYEDPFIGY